MTIHEPESVVEHDRDEMAAIRGASTRVERLYGLDAPTALDLEGES